MNRRFSLLVMVIVACPFMAYGQDASDMKAAQAANAYAVGQTGEKAARENVPGYTPTPPEAALRDADLKSASKARLLACALKPNDPTCQAQIHGATEAARPRPSISPSDPSVATASAIGRDPAQALGGLDQYYSGCSSAGACTADAFCLGANCYTTKYTNDADFARTMTYMEAVREAGVYLDPATMHVFAGEATACRNRLLKNCCYADGAGAKMSNQGVFSVGSRLVYDLLMNSTNRSFVTTGLKALMTGGGFSGSFSSFGVTVAVNGTALPAGSVTLATGENFAIAVDPWSLAIMATIYVLSDLSSCNKDEAMGAMKEGAHLCHTVGEWCSECLRVLGKCVSCITKSTGKCCFNSRLARIVNEQGRAQLGMNWGDAEHPNCNGFTVADLQRLDFAKMDLTEFYESVVPTLPNASDIEAANRGRAAKCYMGAGKC